MQIPKQINNLNARMNQRKFGLLHRTFGWLRFQAFSFRTSMQTKHKRGLPQLLPVKSSTSSGIQGKGGKKKGKHTKNGGTNANTNANTTMATLATLATASREMVASVQRAKIAVQRFSRGAVPLQLVERAQSSVKSFQRGAVPVKGLVGLKFTVGDHEYNATKEKEHINQKAGRRWFTPIQTDMSRSYIRKSDGTRMPCSRCILWTCTESKRAQDLLCEITVVPLKSSEQERISKKQRLGVAKDSANEQQCEDLLHSTKDMKDMKDMKDITIVKHPRLPFELWLKKRGVTPLVSIQLSGKIESKNKSHQCHPNELIKQGYVMIATPLTHLAVTKDKAMAKKTNYVNIRSGLKAWIKTVNTKADLKWDRQAVGALTVREGQKIQHMANMGMLNDRDVKYLFGE